MSPSELSEGGEKKKSICFAHHRGLSCLFVSQFAEIAVCVRACSCLLTGEEESSFNHR